MVFLGVYQCLKVFHGVSWYLMSWDISHGIYWFFMLPHSVSWRLIVSYGVS